MSCDNITVQTGSPLEREKRTNFSSTSKFWMDKEGRAEPQHGLVQNNCKTINSSEKTCGRVLNLEPVRNPASECLNKGIWDIYKNLLDLSGLE